MPTPKPNQPTGPGDPTPDAAAITPTTTALLVMDYQPAVLGAFADPDAILTPAETALRTARAGGLTIAYARVGFNETDYANVPAHNTNLAAAAAGRHLFHDDPVTQVHPRLAPQEGDIVVRKSRVSAFSTTDLDRQLRERGIDTLVLAGIRTGGVVLSTVREAADLDYRLYVLADASADVDPEIHEVLIRKVLPQQATVITLDEFAQSVCE
jgi:nicotinamidase-related amidase